MTEPILLSKKEAAQMLGLSVRTISSYVATKQLRVRRIGRRTLLSRAEIVRFAQRDHAAPAPAKSE